MQRASLATDAGHANYAGNQTAEGPMWGRRSGRGRRRGEGEGGRARVLEVQRGLWRGAGAYVHAERERAPRYDGGRGDAVQRRVAVRVVPQRGLRTGARPRP